MNEYSLDNFSIFNEVFQRKTGYKNDERGRTGGREEGGRGWAGVNNWFPEHNSETVSNI